MVRALVELPDYLRGQNPDTSPIIPPRTGSGAARNRAHVASWGNVQPAPRGQRGWKQQEEAARVGDQARKDAASLGPVDMGEYSEPQVEGRRRRLFRSRRVA